MIITTALFFKDPVKVEKLKKRQQTSLLQTVANAFEIIYSPVVLLFHQMKKSVVWRVVIGLILVGLTGYAVSQYLARPPVIEKYSIVGIERNDKPLLFTIDRDMLGREDYSLSTADTVPAGLTLFKPSEIDNYAPGLLEALQDIEGYEDVTSDEINGWIEASDSKIIIEMARGEGSLPFVVQQTDDQHFSITLNDFEGFDGYKQDLLAQLHTYPLLAGITIDNCDDLYDSAGGRAFFLLFVSVLVLAGLAITAYSNRNRGPSDGKRKESPVTLIIALILGAAIWFIPGLSMVGRIIATTIYLTVTALFSIDSSDTGKFAEHAKFLLMIFLYSGFWILYFQMFDSVLWYVKAYVNAESLNNVINGFLGKFGLNTNWNFDVEHVTVINAGTIILLQLVV